MAAIKAIAAIKKIKKISAAIAVSLTAFFELCLTGRADRAWRLARADSNRPSSRAGADNPEHLKPRPGIFVSRKGAVVTPQATALHISRKVSIGTYCAMTIFLALCFLAFVTCLDGQSLHQLEDGTQRIDKIQTASGTGTEAPSSSAKTMRVTAYCPCSKCCGKYADGITANGHRIKPGDAFVAAPKTIPFGTSLIIPGYNNGKPVRVMDRGGAINAGRLDVFFPDHKEALEWGVRNVVVKSLDNQWH